MSPYSDLDAENPANGPTVCEFLDSANLLFESGE
jgi:hypothetical protein